MRVSLALLALLGAAGCQQTFLAPDKPDLAKAPYDFGVGGPGGSTDMADNPKPDLGIPDLGHPADLSVPPDLTPKDKDAG